MVAFLGKRISQAEADSFIAAHVGKLSPADEDAGLTLGDVEDYYHQEADNEVVYHGRREAAANHVDSPIGLRGKPNA